MDSNSPPQKIARFGNSGLRATNWQSEANEPALDLSRCSDYQTLPIGIPKACGFTILQLQELKLQSLIFSYIEAGYPVPHHLIIPIWKSVVNSLNFHDAALHQQLFGSGSVCGSDAEPGRCRRTDGKKWRCSREALPDQKYCERHMHRGRHRSRKLVEASQGANTMLSISLPPNQ